MQNDGGRALPEALVSAIYDAALEPGRWPDVLARLARFADDSMASLNGLP